MHTQDSKKESDCSAGNNGFANNPDGVRNVSILEGESSMDCVNEAGRNLESPYPEISLEKGNPILMFPKISVSGDRIPLSFNSKGSIIRNAKYKKGYPKKSSRSSVSGKENIATNLVSPSGPRITHPLPAQKGHEPLPSSHLSGVPSATGFRDVCGRAIERTNVDSGPPVSKWGKHRGELVPAAGAPKPTGDDEGGVPYVMDGPMRPLRKLYLSVLPQIPLNEFDRYPSFPLFNMSIKI